MPEETLLSVALEIRELIRLIAEPAIAQRDQKLRSTLREIVGRSTKKADAVFLLDGTRTQAEISQMLGFHKSDLSRLVKQLREVDLLAEDEKPRLKISIPPHFFEVRDDSK